MFNSQTYGQVDIEGAAKGLLDFYKRTEQFDELFEITIGTDSQTFSKETKVVSVIAAHREHHGGIFFYETTNIDKLTDIRRKLTEETMRSLNTATELTGVLESSKKFDELRNNSLISIHIDAGWSDKGKTKNLIPGLIGWITSCGFSAEVKPESYAASSIADKISK